MTAVPGPAQRPDDKRRQRQRPGPDRDDRQLDRRVYRELAEDDHGRRAGGGQQRRGQRQLARPQAARASRPQCGEQAELEAGKQGQDALRVHVAVPQVDPAGRSGQ